MRGKVLVLLMFLSFSLLPVIADDWDDFDNLDRMWDGQKSITNQEFEQVMEALNSNEKKKEEKQRKKKVKKFIGGGTSLHSELNPESDIKEIQKFKPKEEGILVNLPVDIYADGQLLEKGFYKLIAERDKENNKIYVKFYQSQYFRAKIEVIETQDDFGEEELDFAKVLPYNDSFVKMIFGSIEFNAYVYLPFVTE